MPAKKKPAAKAAKSAAETPAESPAPKPTEVKLGAAKGRPMLQWVGKKPLSRVTAFPAQLVETFDPAGEQGTGNREQGTGNREQGISIMATTKKFSLTCSLMATAVKSISYISTLPLTPPPTMSAR